MRIKWEKNTIKPPKLHKCKNGFKIGRDVFKKNMMILNNYATKSHFPVVYILSVVHFM